MKNRYFIYIVPTLCVALLCGCAGGVESESPSAPAPAADYAVNYTETDLDETVDAATSKSITLNGDLITFDGTDTLARVDGNTVTVTAGGSYIVSGTLCDGQIVVDTSKDETVRLILSGADISSQSGAPIWIREAKKVVILSAPETENRITDHTAASEDASGDAPNAAVFSMADLTFSGAGKLAVTAENRNGIQSKDKLKIVGGDLSVTAGLDGIKGKDCVAVRAGNVTVTAEQDGIKATNTDAADVGFVRIDGGQVNVRAEQDGIQAETGLVIADGAVSAVSGGGSENAAAPSPQGRWQTGTTGEDTASAKGLKAGADILIEGGQVTADSSDDALHSDGNIQIGGGSLQLAAGDDGIHADDTLTVGGGKITVSKSYEGLEAQTVLITAGTVRITASDDGINAAGGNDTSAPSGRPGQDRFAGAVGTLVISGGDLLLDAGGDGLDSNGTITMTGGSVFVYGPTDNGNGAIDYQSTFTFDGGTLAAAGAAGMAESATDGDGTVLFVVCPTAPGDTAVRVTDQSGQEVFSVVPTKSFSSVVIAAPAIVRGKTYTVTVGEESAEVTASALSNTCSLGGASAGGMGGMGGSPGGMQEPPNSGGVGQKPPERPNGMEEPPGGKKPF